MKCFFFVSTVDEVFFLFFFSQKNFHATPPPRYQMLCPLDQVESFTIFFSNFLQFEPILAQILEKIDPFSIIIPNFT